MVKIDITSITSHCSAGTGELDPKPEPFGRCQCGESRSPAQHKLQHQGNPSPTTHNSSRAHSPLPILISLPLAKESPQFPLPPRAAAFFFQVVNYNSRAKSTVNFHSLPKQFNIASFCFCCPAPQEIQPSFSTEPSLHFPVFQQAHRLYT